MRRHSKYLLSAALLIGLYLFYSLLVAHVEDEDHRIAPIKQTSLSDTRPKAPKITVIVIWVPRSEEIPIYLPYFFQSVEANPEVDLLFVEVDKLYLGCKTYSSAQNVQHLCLTEEEYYNLHVDFLCKKWKCTEDIRELVLDKMMEEADLDINNSFFRILRNGIFEPWINSATTIWGWCDADEYWGNFARTFPWDVAHDFDVLAPSSQPDPSNMKLIFTRGHMAFFRNSPDVLDRLLSFRKFATFSKFLYDAQTLIDAEESQFSHFIFSEEKSFTFLTFEAMENSWDTVFLSSKGVFYSNMKKDEITEVARRKFLALIRPENSTHLPTFSIEGIEEQAVVFTDGKDYDSSLWFDKKFATYVVTGWIRQQDRDQKGFIMRREPHGPVTQRREPREPHLHRNGNVQVDECLYKHWQFEKHDPWFKKIPKGGLGAKTVFVQYKNAEAEIWDEEGTILHRASL